MFTQNKRKSVKWPLNFRCRSPSTHNMSPFVRKLFLGFLPKLMMMRRTKYVMPDYDDAAPCHGYANRMGIRYAPTFKKKPTQFHAINSITINVNFVVIFTETVSATTPVITKSMVQTMKMIHIICRIHQVTSIHGNSFLWFRV